jgi:hypothetical protein
MYKSHVDACIAFVRPVMNVFRLRADYEYIRNMIRFHDIGKRGKEFQRSIRKRKVQYIRHEELAFVLWLDSYPDLMCLDEPQILAILSHHRTLIDEESAIKIEKYISEHDNMEELSGRWINMLKTPRKNRIDTELLLPALKLVDILRTIDILASYTTETALHLFLNIKNHDSLFASAYTDLSRELSSINIRANEIGFHKVGNGKEAIEIQIQKPVNFIVEYRRKE